MNRRRIAHHCLVLVLAILLGGIAGCNLAVATNMASFALGFATAAKFQTTTAEYRCFRGGVEIPCGDLPPSVGQ